MLSEMASRGPSTATCVDITTCGVDGGLVLLSIVNLNLGISRLFVSLSPNFGFEGRLSSV
jgi:hypothetical protein